MFEIELIYLAEFGYEFVWLTLSVYFYKLENRSFLQKPKSVCL